MAIQPVYADLSRYQRGVQNAQQGADLLNSLIGGLQQGVQLQQLPQKLQENALAQQLQNAINLQKLQDLQNPQAALARDIERQLTIKGALNPELGITRSPVGLVGETVFNPAAITAEQQAALPSPQLQAQRQLALEQAGIPLPEVVIPTAPAALPETPVSAFGIQTGLNINPNIPEQAQEDKLNRQIQLANARVRSSGVQGQFIPDGFGGMIFAQRPTTPTGEIRTTRVTTPEGEAVKVPPKGMGKGGAGLTPNAQASLLQKYGEVKELVGDINDPKFLDDKGSLDYNKLAVEVGNAKRIQAINDLNAKSKSLTSKQKDEIGSFISAKKDLENLKTKVISLDSTTGEPGFWQNAFAVEAATPSTGIWSSAIRQLASMALTDETKSKESTRAGLEQAVKTALSGKTVSAGENITLTALLPKSDDTLKELLGKIANLDEFLNNRIAGTREAGLNEGTPSTRGTVSSPASNIVERLRQKHQVR